MEENINNQDPKKPVSPQEFSKKIKEKYPEYKNVDDLVLAEKMIEKYPEYKSQVDFSVKKKDQAQLSSSTTDGKSSDSAQKTGSSATKKPMKQYAGLSSEEMTQMKQPVAQKAAQDSAAKFNKIQDPNIAKQHQKAAVAAYKQSTAVSPQEVDIAKQEVEDEVNTVGFVNNVKSGVKKGWNMVADAATALASLGTETTAMDNVRFDTDPLKEEKKEAQAQLLKEVKTKSAITPQLVEERAKEIKLEKKIDGIKQSKLNEFMQGLDYGQKSALEIDRIENYKTVTEENKNTLKELQLKKSAAEHLAEDYIDMGRQISDMARQGATVDPEVLQQYKSVEDELKGHVSELTKLNNKYLSGTKNIGDAEEELDILKREYGWSDNFFGNIGASAGELALNTLSGLEYIGTLGGNLDVKDRSKDVINDINKVKEAVSASREKLMKPLEEVNSVNDFIDYTSNLVANQLPTLAVVSTGVGGLATIGTSGAGSKYSEMVEKNQEGKTKYNKLQMAISPLVFGGAEVISEIPTLSILKKGKRVFTAVNATPAGQQMVKESFKKQVAAWGLDFGKDVSGETAGELVTNTLQNLNSILVEGDKTVSIFDNSERVLKDAVLLTSILKVAPHLAVMPIKAMQPKSKTMELDSNAKAIISLTEKLETEGLSPKVKEVIQEQRDKLVTANNSIIKQTIKDIDKMPEESFDKIVEIDKKSATLKSKAAAIKEDPAIDIPTKVNLLKSLELEFKENEALREKIVSPTATVLDALPEKEQEKLKGKAEKELTKAATTDGKKAPKFDSEEINNKAIAIYNDSKQVSAEPAPVSTEPQASVLSENKDNNETAPQGDTATDGNLRSGAAELGEVATERPQASGEVREESVQSAVEPSGPVEEIQQTGTVKKVKSLKDAEYDVHFDDNGQVTKIISPKDGREIPRFREVKKVVKNPVTQKTEEKIVLQKNANYSRIESDATGGVTNNKAKEERIATEKAAMDSFTPQNEYDHAVDYLARGGNINIESAKKETGLSAKEVRWTAGFNKDADLPSVEKAAEQIVMNSQKNLDESTVRSALIDIISNKNIQQLKDDIVAQHEEGNTRMQEDEFRAFMGSLSEQERTLVESQMAEDEYLEGLTENEKILYYEQQYGPEQIQEDRLDGPKQTIAEPNGSDTGIQEREGAKPETATEKITESQLPDITKKGSVKSIPLSDTVEAKVSVQEFMDGENGYSVQLYQDGELIEDKHGDTETEFTSEETADLAKFLDSKRKGYALSQKGKHNKPQGVKVSVSDTARRVSFNMFGVESFGTQQPDGSIIGDDNMKYSKGMQSNGIITDVAEIAEGKDYRMEGDVAAQGIFGGGSRTDSSLSKGGGTSDRNFYQNKTRRLWNRLFKSNAGLDFKSGETMRSLQRDIDYLQDLMGTDTGIFKNVLKKAQKSAKNKEDFRLKLLALGRYMQGSKGELEFLGKPERENLEYLRSRIDGLTEKVINTLEDQLEGMEGEKAEKLTEFIEKMRENKGKYINRSYQIFHDEKYREAMAMSYDKMPGEYKRRYDNAVDFLVREEGMDKKEAESYISGYLDDIIRSKNDISVGFAGRADAPFLKKRKDLPVEFQELLGVVRDPLENYLRTVDKISRYLASLKYQERLKAHLVDTGIGITEPKQGYTKMTSDAKEWDMLSDMYVPVEFKQAMEDMLPLDKVNQGWLRAWIQFASMTKVGKTVLNPSGVFRNFMSGTFLGLNAGHFNWINPESMHKALSQAFKTETAVKKMADLRKELIQQEIIGSGADSQEMLAFMNDFSASIDRKLSANPLMPIMNGMQKAYAFGDDFYKVSGYIIEKRRLMDTGIPEKEAIRMAGERIRGGYPTYSYLPRAFKELRRLPLVGTFISFPYEVVRSTKNNAMYVHEDWNNGRKKMAMQRAAGMVVANAIPTLAAAYVAAMVGIDDEDDDKMRELLPDYQRDALLLYYGKDERGYPKFVDLTAFAPSEVIVKPLRIVMEEREGRDMDEKLWKSSVEIIKPYLGYDLSYKTANELMTNNDEFDKKIYKAESFAEALTDKKDLTQILNYYAKKAGPGVYSNISDFMRANEKGSDVLGDKFTAYGKEYTNEDATLGFFGIRTSTVNYYQAILNNNKRATAELNDNKEFLRKAMKSTSKMSDDRMELNFNSYIKGEDEAYKKVLRGVQIGFKFSLDKGSIAATFENAKYSKKDEAFLMNGFQPPYDYISKKTAINNTNEIRSNYTPDKAQSVINTYKDNIMKFNEMVDKKNKELYEKNNEVYKTLFNRKEYEIKNPLK